MQRSRVGRSRLAQRGQPRRPPGEPRLPASASWAIGPICSRRARRTARRWRRARSSTTAGSTPSRGPNVELVTDADRPDRPRGHRHRVGPDRRGRRDRLRHRVRDQQVPVADGGHRSRRDASTSCGRRTAPAPTSASRCPGFPNLFCIYGPNTNSNQGTHPDDGLGAADPVRDPVHRGAVPHRRSRRSTLTREAYDDYNRRLDEGLAQDDLLRSPARHLLHQRARAIVVADVLVDAGVLADDPPPRLLRLRAVLTRAGSAGRRPDSGRQLRSVLI